MGFDRFDVLLRLVRVHGGLRRALIIVVVIVDQLDKKIKR